MKKIWKGNTTPLPEFFHPLQTTLSPKILSKPSQLPAIRRRMTQRAYFCTLFAV